MCWQGCAVPAHVLFAPACRSLCCAVLRCAVLAVAGQPAAPATWCRPTHNCSARCTPVWMLAAAGLSCSTASCHCYVFRCCVPAADRAVMCCLQRVACCSTCPPAGWPPSLFAWAPLSAQLNVTGLAIMTVTALVRSLSTPMRCRAGRCCCRPLTVGPRDDYKAPEPRCSPPIALLSASCHNHAVHAAHDTPHV